MIKVKRIQKVNDIVGRVPQVVVEESVVVYFVWIPIYKYTKTVR